MLPQKFISDLRQSDKQFKENAATMNKVRIMSRSQLQELKDTGTPHEKVSAALELKVRESDEYISMLMKSIAKTNVNDALKEALRKAGYRLVGHIEKM